MATLPSIVVEASLLASTTTTDLYLNDAARGKLDTGTLAGGTIWTDISAYVREFSTSRGRNRATEAWKAGTATVVLDNQDGRFDPENLSGPYVVSGATQLMPMVPVRISATYAGMTYQLFQGFADEWACTYPGNLDAVTTLSITDAMKVIGKFTSAAASATAGSGEGAGARIGRILDLWNWPAGDRDLDAGLNTLQGTTLSGNALDEILLTAASEYGDFFIDHLGRATFRQRYARSTQARSIAVQATFSDVAADVSAGSAIGYTSLSRVGDGDLIRNVVTRGNVGGTASTVTDVVSVARFQKIADVKTDLVNNTDAQAATVASWILSLFGTYEQRVESITVMPASAPTVAWPIMLDLRFLDRVNVVRTPPNVSAITSANFVQGIEWSGNAENWVVKVWLESATNQTGLLILDSASRGILDTYKLAA